MRGFMSLTVAWVLLAAGFTFLHGHPVEESCIGATVWLAAGVMLARMMHG